MKDFLFMSGLVPSVMRCCVPCVMRIPVHERSRPFCQEGFVEYDLHVLTNCSLCVDYRSEAYAFMIYCTWEEGPLFPKHQPASSRIEKCPAMNKQKLK